MGWAQAESLAERHQTLAHQRNHSVALHLDERHVRANGLLLQQPGLMAKLQARTTPSAALHPVLHHTQCCIALHCTQCHSIASLALYPVPLLVHPVPLLVQ